MSRPRSFSPKKFDKPRLLAEPERPQKRGKSVTQAKYEEEKIKEATSYKKTEAWLRKRGYIALAALILFAGCASAQPETDRRELRRQLRSSCDFWGNCTKYWEYYRPVRRYQPAERVYAFRRSEPSHPHCLDRISAVGEERQGTERAQEEAVRKWSNAVRFDIGVRYMDLQNADDIAYECVQSSTGERTSEKLTAALGREALMQCQIRAIPCRAKKDHGER